MPLPLRTMLTGIAPFSARLVLLLAIPSLVAACGLDTQGSKPTDTGTGGNAGSTPGVGGSGGVGASGGGGGTGGTGGAPPACGAGNECVPAILAGWTAAAVLVENYTDGATHTCADGSQAKVHFAEPADSASCAPCTCSFDGYSCTSPYLSCTAENDSCQMGGMTGHISDTDCHDFNNVPNGNNYQGSCKLDPPKLNVGSCTGGDSQVTGSPWGKVIFVCPLPAADGACAGTDVCLPTGGEPSATICVEQANGGDCPAGWTGSSIDAFDGTNDTRSCSKCGCDPNSVTCEGGSFTIYDDDGCNTNGESVKLAPLSCTTIHNFFDGGSASYRAEMAKPKDGTCTQATPSGSVTGTGPRKFCCR
ncbi:hypothetical protein [Polyangium aurulentum]|uniref:hypothetical protein n=1 Tax=Polyangium aurulentum TaxID=2567896 RepID=UPI0010AE0B0F|nr:hypothetical protein [Polyangium aurulentum]UQA61890.1 hypothetical protein E8A73_016020 [Polyangium aurulentum]